MSSYRGIFPLEFDIKIADFLLELIHQSLLRLQSVLLEKQLTLQLIVLFSVAINSSMSISLNLFLILPKLSDLAL